MPEPELEKRTECYVYPPHHFSIAPCSKCGAFKELQWSEFKDRIWCPTCEVDFEPDHWGVVDGPCPVRTCEMMGICFDRYRFSDDQYLTWDSDKCDYIESVALTEHDGSLS